MCVAQGHPPCLFLLLPVVLPDHWLSLASCHCLPVVLPVALPVCCCLPVALPLLVVVVIVYLWSCLCLLLFTCDPASRLPVASPPLQQEEGIAPLRHPQLQSVFQQNFLRVQPHVFSQGGTGRTGGSLLRGLWSVQRRGTKFPGAGPPPLGSGPERSYSGGVSAFSMIPLRLSNSCRFHTSSGPHTRFTAVHTIHRSSTGSDDSLCQCNGFKASLLRFSNTIIISIMTIL